MTTMPLYEYACSRCSNSFEELVSIAAAPPACPACGQNDAVAHIPIGRLTVVKKEDNRPPNIKSFVRPRRW
jgi:putative FmdB family regulatory protein